MESLKDKFHQSKSYQEKLQIQSPFTIEETQHFPVLCMMQECKSCPGKEGVVNLLISLGGVGSF